MSWEGANKIHQCTALHTNPARRFREWFRAPWTFSSGAVEIYVVGEEDPMMTGLDASSILSATMRDATTFWNGRTK